ncbi:Golgi apyrase [Dispira simplex]|nr:Golgi apyrase [Dispira simplex]
MLTRTIASKKALTIGLVLLLLGLAYLLWPTRLSSSTNTATSPLTNQESNPSIVPDTDWNKHRQYAVVIDAGSSGSRIQVYSWNDPYYVRENTGQRELLHGLPVIEKGDQKGIHWQFKESPGLSSYAGKPHRLTEHLRPLLASAHAVVPTSKVPHTPVYLYATAGLRLLPPMQQALLLDKSCQYFLQHSKFNIESCASHFRVISGAAEGIYGWMAINYLLGGFTKSGEHRFYPETTENSIRRTYGFLDMGGASTQIAFEPTNQTHPQDLTTLTLRHLDGYAQVYRVFTTTFLGFGSNQARKRYVEALLTDHGLLGDNVSDQPRTALSSAVPDPCLPVGLTLTEEYPGPSRWSAPRTAQLQGTGDFQTCAQRTVSLLNKALPCTLDPCLFNGVYTPPIDFAHSQFVGISEYWYSAQDIFHLGGVWDFQAFEKKATEYCQTTWQQIQQEMSSNHQMDRLQLQCFKAAWLTTVLHDGFGVPHTPFSAPVGSASAVASVSSEGTLNVTDKLKHLTEEAHAHNLHVPFQSVNDVNGFEVSWTLGVALLRATTLIPPAVGEATSLLGDPVKVGIQFPKSSPSAFNRIRGGLSSSAVVLWVVGLMVVMALGILLTLWSRRRAQSLTYSHLYELEEDGDDTTVSDGRGKSTAYVTWIRLRTWVHHIWASGSLVKPPSLFTTPPRANRTPSSSSVSLDTLGRPRSRAAHGEQFSDINNGELRSHSATQLGISQPALNVNCPAQGRPGRTNYRNFSESTATDATSSVYSNSQIPRAISTLSLSSQLKRRVESSSQMSTTDFKTDPTTPSRPRIKPLLHIGSPTVSPMLRPKD